MLLFEEIFQFAICFQLLELFLQVRASEFLLLQVNGLLALCGSLPIQPLDRILLLLGFAVLLLPRHEKFFLSQQFLDPFGHLNVALLLRNSQALLQLFKALVLVLLDEGVALGEESAVQMAARLIEPRIAGEVLVTGPFTSDVP